MSLISDFKDHLKSKYINLPDVYDNIIVFFTQYIFHIFGIIYFNFKHLPFKQAIKLPIWIIARRPSSYKGKVTIDAEKITCGMIQMGHRVSLNYRKGIVFVNKGYVTFKGNCLIGNESFLWTWEKGNIIFGNNLGASSSQFISMRSMEFKENINIGFDCVFMDTDFHAIKYMNKKLKVTGPVVIGSNTWIGAKCIVKKNTHTPNYCIVGANSVLDKFYKYPEHCIISGNPAELKGEKFTWDKFDDLPIDVY